MYVPVTPVHVPA